MSKGVDAQARAHLAKHVQRILERDFDNNQSAAAKKLGISQGHISQMLKGPEADRGIGIDALVRFRRYAKISLDELLGFAPPAIEKMLGDQISELQHQIHELQKQVESMRRENLAARADEPKRSTVRPRKKV